MKNWKQKILLAILCLVLALALAACSNSNNEDETVPTDTRVADSPTIPVVEDEPTEAATYVPYAEDATDEADEPTEEIPTAEEPTAEELTEETPAIEEPIVETPTIEEPTEAVDETPIASAGTLSGVFVLEDDDVPMELAFNANGTFTITMAFDSLAMGVYIPGDISIGGVYAIDEAAQIITLNVEEENILELVLEILNTIANYMMNEIIADEFGDEFGALAEDEDFMDGFMQMMLAMMDHMFDEIFEDAFNEVADMFEEMVLRFEDNFDRLYLYGTHDYDAVFVRQ